MKGKVTEDQKAINTVKTQTEKYNESIIKRAAVSAIPYIGAPIDVLLTGGHNLRWQERVNSLLEELEKRLIDVDYEKIDHDYIQSDEFQSIIQRIILNLQYTHENEKIKFFADIISNSSRIKFSQEVNKERFIGIIDSLTMTHIHIIKLFSEKYSAVVKDEKKANVILNSKEIAIKIGITKIEAEAFCADLQYRGLLYDPQIGLAEYERGSYALHSSAFALLDFINFS